MIDWLRAQRSDPWGDPKIDVGGRLVPLAIRRHKGAKRLTMRLSPDGSELRVTMPSWGRSLDAIDFAKARTEWIARQLAKVPGKLALEPGGNLAFRGGHLLLDWRADASRKPRREGERLIVGGPRERLETRTQSWLESVMLEVGQEDLHFYCCRAQKPVPALRLSRARRRWGSCSGDNAQDRCIRINWRLIMAPDFVRRSVIAHEVAHLSHFDHSPAFYAHLIRLFEADLGAADLWLKREGPTLYTAFA